MSPPENTVEHKFSRKSTLIANDLMTMSLLVADFDIEVNDSQLNNLFNQIGKIVSGCVYMNFATQQLLDKEFDLKYSFLMDSKRFLHYGDEPFRSHSFFNQSSITMLAAADDFVYAKSFPDLSVLEENVKEMEDDAAPPWKVREEVELMFADLGNMISSPEPPWELLRHGTLPHDRGKIERTVEKLLVSVVAHHLGRVRCSSFGPTLGRAHFQSIMCSAWASFTLAYHAVYGPLLIGPL